MNIDNTMLQRKISFLYMGALSFVAILSTLSFYVLYKSLEASSSTAYIVNISGKQRMLSQHIALNLYRIHIGLQKHDGPKHDIDLTKQKLLEQMRNMSNINNILSSGELPDGKKIELSPTVYKMYFGTMNIKKRVDEYIEIANKIVSNTGNTNIDAILKSIDIRSEQLGRSLNKVVEQYELEGEKKLQKLGFLELIAWVLVIFTLLIEVIFIFQPILKKMIFLISENNNVMQHLEYEVELRTLELKEANTKLHEMASHDSMTGLKNRLMLESDIEKSIEHYKEHNAPFSLLMLDIDWFKETNDKYGHDIGDRVIKEISNILSNSVREEDKVYRAGGEEFVILLNRISLENTQKIAQKIRVLIEEYVFKAESDEFHKTISIGLYHSSMEGVKNTTELFKKVDNALYISKENGRNQVTDVSQLGNK